VSEQTDLQLQITEYFKDNLHRGLGDLETMLAGIWYRAKNKGKQLDPHKRPPGYRSPKLREYLRQECGANKTTLWGPTAIRGDLGEADKEHIIRFLELVNELPDELLEETLELCGYLYAEKVNGEFGKVVLPSDSVAQIKLIEAIRTTGTVGKIQQGLVYATLRVENRKRGERLNIVTKRTHAGDQQSGEKGDISVFDRETMVTAYEVKGVTLTQQGADRFLPLHGEHEYGLFILALDFRPKSLQDELNAYKNTFAVSILDFLLTKLADIQAIDGSSTEEIIQLIITVYNSEFCEKIENDESIKIVVED
jgi:hypothetical protein